MLQLCAHSSPSLRRYAAFCLLNLAAKDELKPDIVRLGGVEACVQLQASDEAEVRSTASDLLLLLQDVPFDDELKAKRANLGVEGMVRLCASGDVMLQRMAAEALADEVVERPAKLPEVLAAGGLSALMGVLQTHARAAAKRASATAAAAAAATSPSKSATPHGAASLGLELEESAAGASASAATSSSSSSERDQADRGVLLPALWGLRNLTRGNYRCKGEAGRDGAVELLLSVLRSFGGTDPQVCEAALACLVALVQEHEPNARRLLSRGLDLVLDAAEGVGIAMPSGAHKQALELGMEQGAGRVDLEERAGGALTFQPSPGEVEEARDAAVAQASLLEAGLDLGQRQAKWASERADAAEAEQQNRELALVVLQLLKPYNWIRCKRCGVRQASGERCVQCGHKIRFEIEVSSTGSTKKEGGGPASSGGGGGGSRKKVEAGLVSFEKKRAKRGMGGRKDPAEDQASYSRIGEAT